MSRTYKLKRGALIYTRTPEDVLEKAQAEQTAGASQKSVCEKYHITRSVFQRYLKQHSSGEPRRTPGGQTILTYEAEQSIVEHLLVVSAWGFPFDMLDLWVTIKRLLDKQGMTIRKFKNNLPGEEWSYSFMKRHSDKIKRKMPNQKENLIAGFRKCGITPLDITPVLERLPSEPSESLNSSISEAFTQQLIQLRQGSDAPSRRRRRTRLDVVPGRSISNNTNREAGSSSASIDTSAYAVETQSGIEEETGSEQSSNTHQNEQLERNVFEVFGAE